MPNLTKTPETILDELGIQLTPPRKSLGNYVSCMRTGNLIYSSGQIADQYEGKLGAEVTIDEGYNAARQAMINLLRILKEELGELSKIKRVVKVFGMVNCTLDFTEHPKVINGASNLLVEVLGEKGKHARSAVGMAQLPKNSPVEIEIIVEVED